MFEEAELHAKLWMNRRDHDLAIAIGVQTAHEIGLTPASIREYAKKFGDHGGPKEIVTLMVDVALKMDSIVEVAGTSID